MIQKGLAVLRLDEYLCLNVDEIAKDIIIEVEVRKIYCTHQDKVILIMHIPIVSESEYLIKGIRLRLLNQKCVSSQKSFM